MKYTFLGVGQKPPNTQTTTIAMMDVAMRIFQRYHQLTLWNKIGFWGAIASIIGLALYIWPARSPLSSITAGHDIINAPRGVMNTGSGNIYIGTEVHLPDRHLSDDEKSRLKNELAGITRDIVSVEPDIFRIGAASNSDEAKQYADEFVKLFQSFGVNAQGPIDIPFKTTDKSKTNGLLIWVYDEKTPPKNAITFREAMKRAGFAATFVQYENMQKNWFYFIVGYQP